MCAVCDVLSSWLDRHWDWPYPKPSEMRQIAKDTGLNLNQVRHRSMRETHRTGAAGTNHTHGPVATIYPCI
jgi:hypothetical protein